MSFQAFRGEPLYSDCVVKPENKMTETEDYECYPRPYYVKQNGDEQGYYPDTTIAYIRVLWKEWEPLKGRYNYDFIQSIIEKAKAHQQTLIFRLMPHSTRASDDVPEWLKSLMECPERPDGKRVKDSPTDPLFIEYFSLAIKALGEKFDNESVFDTIDISLPGAWGEGHKLELYATEDLEKLFDTYTTYFKNTRLIGQIARTELIKRASSKCAVGARADGFGDNEHIYNNYPPKFEMISNLWQTAPISFESFWWLSEWKRQGWDIDELIQLSLKWHISSFNAKSLPIPFEWKAKIETWIDKMGYHFSIDYFKFPDMANKCDKVEFKLGIDNVGVAPIYDKVPLYVRFKGKNTFVIMTETNVTTWLPGKNAERFIVNLPQDIEAGSYDIEIGIFGGNYNFIYFIKSVKSK